MKYRNATTVSRVRELLSYDLNTGLLTWRTHRSGQPRPGSIAGVIAPDGYRKVRLDGVNYQAHRLIWLYMTGRWPKEEIDHKDLIKSNNKWNNLREASHQNNMCNVPPKKRTRNVGALKGAYRHEGRWFGRIKVNGKIIHLGMHDTQHEAHAAYCAAAARYHGNFARG